MAQEDTEVAQEDMVEAQGGRNQFLPDGAQEDQADTEADRLTVEALEVMVEAQDGLSQFPLDGAQVDQVDQVDTEADQVAMEVDLRTMVQALTAPEDQVQDGGKSNQNISNDHNAATVQV